MGIDFPQETWNNYHGISPVCPEMFRISMDHPECVDDVPIEHLVI